MSYFLEIRRNWRPILAAAFGLGTGLALNGTVTSAMAPRLIADNHWSKASFAALGGLGLLTALALPLVGRLADLIGVKRTATIGLIATPLLYLAYSMMSGALAGYAIIFLIQAFICVTTTSTVYTRLAVQCVREALGLALALVATGPALASGALGPLLNSFIEQHGWRAAYQGLALVTAVTGIITMLLIPADGRKATIRREKRRARDDYPRIFAAPAFWILASSMLLCNLPQVITLFQLKLVLLDNGMTAIEAGAAFTALSIGTLGGRLLTGAALDRFNPYLVSAITLGLPGIGLFLFAAGLHSPVMLLTGVCCLGFAFGAEGDVISYLVARKFEIPIYSSVLGLLTSVIAIASAIGAGLLAYILARTGHFALFLDICAVGVFAGAALLLLLGRTQGDATDSAPEIESVNSLTLVATEHS